jgi:hypothetical protein
VTTSQPAAESVDRDRGDHRCDDRREPDPLLGVVPADDGLEHGDVPGPRGVVGECALDDVGERPVGRGDHGSLVDVERAPAEADDAEHERERRAEVRQRPVDEQESSHEIVRTACRAGGVCRDTHRSPR